MSPPLLPDSSVPCRDRSLHPRTGPRRLLSSIRPNALSFAPMAAFFLAACPGGPTTTDGGPIANDGGPTADGGAGGGNDPCPAGANGGTSVCQVQNPTSPAHPSAGATVTLNDVVALSDVFDLNSTGTIQAVFVADVPLATYGGVLVTFPADQNVAVSAGQRVNVSGTVQEFSSGAQGSETRVQATAVQATGASAELSPLDVADPSVLADEITGEAYEGMLVRVRSVEVTNPDLGFGQFEVTGGLVVDDSIFRYAAIEGEVLGSITGVLGYNAFESGGFRLLPRNAADVESTSKPSVNLRQLRDPAADGYIAACEFCPGTSSSCAPSRVSLSEMVVVSQTYYIGSGPLFGFFVADPTLVDAEGRLTAHSGILATIRPSDSRVVQNSYSFTQDQEFNFVGENAAPMVGDVVNIVGENGGFCGMAQLSGVTDLVKVGTAGDTDMPAMPMPARFDGSLANTDDARHPARLAGGRPAVTVEEGGVARDAVAADAAVESWEGVWVELVNVATEEACVGYPYANASNNVAPYLRDFGYFTVTGGAEVGTLFDTFDFSFGGYWKNVAANTTDRTCANVANKCEDSRAAGQEFTSLSGIVNYSYGVYRLNPRSAGDFQPPELFVAGGSGNCE